MRKKHDCSLFIVRHFAPNGYVDMCSICCRQVAWNFTRGDGSQCVGSIWENKTYSYVEMPMSKPKKVFNQSTIYYFIGA